MSTEFHAFAGRTPFHSWPTTGYTPGSGLARCFSLCCCLDAFRSSALGATVIPGAPVSLTPPSTQLHLRGVDNDLIDDISRRSFRYFWEQTNRGTGLVLDRASVNGASEDTPEHRGVASIAATGFGLTALCIGADHRWVSPVLARQRVLTALKFFADRAPRGARLVLSLPRRVHWRAALGK